MRRAQFLALTGLGADGLEALARRDLLPFRVSREGPRKGWSQYGHVEAFKTMLSLRLATVGMTQLEAARFVSGFYDDALKRLQQQDGNVKGDCYFGFATIEDPPSGDGPDAAGSRMKILLVGWNEATALQLKDADALYRKGREAVVASALVNASWIVREIARRGVLAGLDAKPMRELRPWFGAT